MIFWAKQTQPVICGINSNVLFVKSHAMKWLLDYCDAKGQLKDSVDASNSSLFKLSNKLIKSWIYCDKQNCLSSSLI